MVVESASSLVSTLAARIFQEIIELIAGLFLVPPVRQTSP